MPDVVDRYFVESEAIPLVRKLGVGVVVPARDENALVVASRLSRSSRLSIDAAATSSQIIVRGDPQKVANISSYRDVKAVRSSFTDSSGHELLLGDEIVLGFAPETSDADQQAVLRAYDLRIVEQIPGKAWRVVVNDPHPDAPLRIANQLTDESEIEYAEPNALQSIVLLSVPSPTDDRFVNQWHLENTGQGGGTAGADVKALEAWAYGFGNESVRIAIHDNGVDIAHVDLAGNVDTGRDFDNDDTNPTNNAGAHGTACAGIAAAALNDAGVVGIAPRCRIVGVRATNARRWSEWAETIDWVIGRADVLSCSWTISRNRTLADAFRRAARKGRAGRGMPIFVAAGNGAATWNNGGSISFPSSLASTIAVGASTDADVRAAYSQFGAGLDVVAPSSGGTQGIETTDNSGASGYNSQVGREGDYCEAGTGSGFGGTSAATPLAAGVAALMLSANPDLSGEEVRQVLRDTADRIDTENLVYDGDGWNQQVGHGRVNARAAVQRALALRARTSASGDFSGDGRAEVLVSSGWGIGVLRLDDGQLDVVAAVPNQTSLSGWRLNTDNDRFGPVGDFSGDGRAEVLVSSGWGIGVLRLDDGQLDVVAAVPNQTSLSGWRLNTDNDRFGPVGDFSGDGRAEVLVSSGWGIGVLRLDDGQLDVVAAVPNQTSLSGWRLNTDNDRFGPVGDFSGDGRAEVLVSSGWGIGVLRLDDGQLDVVAAVPNQTSLSGWRLNTDNDRFGPVGDFSGDGRAEVLVSSGWGIGVLRLDDGQLDVVAAVPNQTSLSGWRLNTDNDRFGPVGDFSGDGRAEVLVSSGWGIGVLRLDDGQLDVVAAVPNQTSLSGWRLNTDNDRFGPVGDFSGDGRAEVLVSSGWGIGVLRLDDGQLDVVAAVPNQTSLSGWRLNTDNDRFGAAEAMVGRG